MVVILDKFSRIFLVDAKVGEMDKFLVDLSWIIVIRLSRKPHQPIIVEIHLERTIRCDKHVHPQIVFKPIDQMGVHNVPRSQDPFLRVYILLAVDDFDSSTAARGDWLQDIELLFILLKRPITLELIELIRQHEAQWSNRVVSGEPDAKSIHVFPQQVFPSELCRAGEVVCLLIFIEVFDVWGHHVTCPL